MIEENTIPAGPDVQVTNTHSQQPEFPIEHKRRCHTDKETKAHTFDHGEVTPGDTYLDQPASKGLFDRDTDGKITIKGIHNKQKFAVLKDILNNNT